MQTTRAIAGRVLVAPSSLAAGIPNIAGKEMTVAHIYDLRSGRSPMQLSAFLVKMMVYGAQIICGPTDLGARGSDRRLIDNYSVF